MRLDLVDFLADPDNDVDVPEVHRIYRPTLAELDAVRALLVAQRIVLEAEGRYVQSMLDAIAARWGK